MAAPREHQAHTVSLRAKWSDEWEEHEGVYCDQFSQVAGPDVAEATLAFNYGKVQRAGAHAPAASVKHQFNGYYVKIVLNQFTEEDDETVRKWYGVVVETSDEWRGTMDGVLTGREIFHCRGLEFLLQRKEVDSSFVLDTNGDEIEIGRAIGFNLGPGRDTDNERHGNMSDTPGERDAHIFAFDIGVGGVSTEAAKTWNVQKIIEYLFHYHPPADIDGADQLNWTVADGGDAEILSKLFPVVHAHGKSVFQLLNELIDRRRLVGWCIDVVGEDEHPKLNLFTFNAETIDLPGGGSVPANGSLQTWFFDDDLSIRQAVIAEDDATRFDVCIARGAHLGACFTIGNSSERSTSLVKDWDTTSQTAYNTGASDSGAYAGLASIDKQAANRAFRADEKLFAKVYKAFLLNPNFNGSIAGSVVCPDPTLEDESGGPSSTSTPFWYPGLRFLDYLPLRTGFNYESVEGFETTSVTIDSSQPNYLRPFAVVDLHTNVFYRLDNPGQGKMTAKLLQSSGRVWAASLRMQDDCPGLLIDVQGAPQHVIAQEEFSPADADDEKDHDAEVDWQSIQCTVFCEFDQHVEARYPSEDLTTETDAVRELIIDVPQMRLDYLAPNTVIGVDEDGALVTSSGGYVRDDRAFLQDLARCAFEWYGQTRKALTVVNHDLVCDYNIGDLITKIGSPTSEITVNSVVTKLVFNLREGTVTVHTQYAELDPIRG